MPQENKIKKKTGTNRGHVQQRRKAQLAPGEVKYDDTRRELVMKVNVILNPASDTTFERHAQLRTRTRTKKQNKKKNTSNADSYHLSFPFQQARLAY